MILGSVCATGSDTAAYLRGKLRLAGIGDDTPLDVVCDAVMVLMVDGVPDLRKWRDQVDIASWKVKPPDRASWGLRPDQAAAAQKLMGQAGK